MIDRLRPPLPKLQNFKPVIDMINFKIGTFNDEMGIRAAPRWVIIFFVISSEVFFVLGSPASGNEEITPLANDIVGHGGVNLLNI